MPQNTIWYVGAMQWDGGVCVVLVFEVLSYTLFLFVLCCGSFVLAVICFGFVYHL